MKKNNINKETLKVLKKARGLFITKLFTSSLVRGSLLVIPLFWSSTISNVSTSSFGIAYQMTIFALLFTMSYYFFQVIDHIIYCKLYSKIYSTYTDLAVSATSQSSIHSLSRFTLGEYTNVINNDIDTISLYFTGGPFRIIRILEFVVIYAYFWSIDFYIFLFTVIISIIMLLILKFGSKKTQEYNIIKKANLDNKTAITHEIFNSMKEIKSFNVFKNINERIAISCNNYLNYFHKYNVYSTNVKISILVISEICRYLIMFYGVYLISLGKMELGTILVIYAYYTKITENFDIIGAFSVDTKDLQVSLSRFNKIIEYRNANEQVKPNETKNYNGKIVFEDILYGDKNDPILNNISLEIKPGEITVITGKAGSGKTGIFELLLKMNKQHAGNVLIDDENSDMISDDIYYSLISSVSQDPKFFDLTIKENLLLIDNNFEKIVEICKMLQIHDDISSLSNGYDTPINSKNENISNNVKQLLAVARVLIKNSKIMLFDESISSLEKNSQEIVLNCLEKMKLDHTIVIISREKEIIKHADQIIVMDGNQVEEIGSHNCLMDNKGCYYKLYSTI